MITIDVLICTINKGIVRILDNLPIMCEGVNYIVSYQYTDERYLELIPAELTTRKDVTLAKHRGKGLSVNRNLALSIATADVVLFADDDARYSPEGFETVRTVFENNPDLDVAFFQASTYTGRPLKKYPDFSFTYADRPRNTEISALETACRRKSIQGRIDYDVRFGLGTDTLTCGEEEIWLTDAERLGMNMRYFPMKIVETSTMLKQLTVYVDPCVQRAYGAISYYRHGRKAWLLCCKFALKASHSGRAGFFSLFRHMVEGISFIRKSGRQ